MTTFRWGWNILDWLRKPLLALWDLTVIVYFYEILRPNLITILATSLSIFAALLFNLLLLVYDVRGRSRGPNGNTNEIRRRFLRELFSNVSFAILVATGAIVSFLGLVLVYCSSVAQYALSALIYYLVMLFLLTLLMLLKRVHVLLHREGDSG